MEYSQALRQAARLNVRTALEEDLGSGDISAALIDPATRARARVQSREAGVFCGELWVRETCAQVSGDIRVDFGVHDGDAVTPGQPIIELEGPAHALLSAERTLLNFVQLLSGTATRTRHFVDLVAGTGVTLLDTRKTIPGLRLAQKYAVRCGGGQNHRIGLFDAYLIKENHIAAAGGIGPAIRRAREQHPELPLEVEVENLEQLQEVLDGGADSALLDNFSLEDTREAVALSGTRLKLEASGGIDERTLRQIAETGVHYISLGTLTKQVRPLDLSMRLLQEADDA